MNKLSIQIINFINFVTSFQVFFHISSHINNAPTQFVKHKTINFIYKFAETFFQ